ncbi:MAG: AI-2E family transporter [Eubacteriales bacterium]
MKPEFNKKYNTIAAYVLVVAAILVSYILVIIYWENLRGVFRTIAATLNPFFYAFAIAYILNPIYSACTNAYTKLFERKKKKQAKAVKVFSLLSVYILALAFLALFFYIIGPQLWLSGQKLMASFPKYIKAVENLLDIQLEDTIFFSSQTISDFLSNTENNLIDWLEKLYSTVTAYTPKLISILTDFAAQVWNFVLGFIISIYMLADKERFIRQSKKLLYALLNKPFAETVITGARKMHSTFGGFVGGKIIDSLIIGLLCFFGMTILRIPYTPLVSVVVGVTNVIPYFGPFMGAIPSLFIILLDNPIKALWFGIFILVLQQLDGNLIGPKIIGQKIGLSSFWVVFSLLIMGSLMGVVGLLLAVPIFALIYDFIVFLCNRSLAKKGLNDDGSPRKAPATDTSINENGDK